MKQKQRTHRTRTETAKEEQQKQRTYEVKEKMKTDYIEMNNLDSLTQEYIRFCRTFLDEYELKLNTTRNLNY